MREEDEPGLKVEKGQTKMRKEYDMSCEKVLLQLLSRGQSLDKHSVFPEMSMSGMMEEDRERNGKEIQNDGDKYQNYSERDRI